MTKNKKKIIAFAGRQRSGKTQLAKLLKNEDDAVIVTIASALKKLCCDILGIDSVDRLNYLKDSKDRIDAKPTDEWALKIAYKTGIEYSDVSKELSRYNNIKDVRQMIQVVGTNIIRKYKPNWHVEQLKKEIKETKSPLVVIDDVRFPNECEAINK